MQPRQPRPCRFWAFCGDSAAQVLVQRFAADAEVASDGGFPNVTMGCWFTENND
jgi:hypothetical protein